LLLKMDQKVSFEKPESVEVLIDKNTVTVKGPSGELSRTFKCLGIEFKSESNEITIESKKTNKTNKMMINTYQAHIKNMIKGALEPFEYKLKICSGHFPMSVTIKGSEFSVKNFLGEKVPRVITIKSNAEVKVDGQEITVKSNDKEKAGQTAANIEQLCRITNRDRRIFQDGIWITQKP